MSGFLIRLMSGKGVPHRKFGNELGQFDRYCKLVLYHEAIDYLQEMQRKSDHEKPLDMLSPEEWDISQQEQSILILCLVLDMADGEIGRVMGMSRSAV